MIGSSTSDTVNPVADQCELAGVPCVTVGRSVGGVLLRPQRRSAEGLRVDLPLLLGLRHERQMCSPTCGGRCRRTRWSATCSPTTRMALPPAKRAGMPARSSKRASRSLDLGLYPPLTTTSGADPALKEDNAESSAAYSPRRNSRSSGRSAGNRASTRRSALPLKRCSSLPRWKRSALVARACRRRSGGRLTIRSRSGLTGQTAKEICDEYEKATGKQWTQPLGFKHANLEVAIDVSSARRSSTPLDPRRHRLRPNTSRSSARSRGRTGR